MTPSTRKRSYRACLRCWQRKSKCDLDGIGEPKKAPCVSCYNSGNQRDLTKSRRGGNFRHRRPGQKWLQGWKESESINSPRHSSGEGSSVTEHVAGDILAMDLRNPSDALQILARSDVNHPNQKVDLLPQAIDAAASTQANESPNRRKHATTALDEYELVQTGVLCQSLVAELLHTYLRNYHPYCPIVPSYFLGPSGMERVQKQDYFLLTAILTIASRDDPSHSLTHRYCWDHTQRLLVDVLLARPWTQTPRTVEGLLLLAEWLPHIQIEETTSEANLFSEDRTAWSLVGLAVRHGYLQRLDQAAFRNTDSHESMEKVEQQRLIWAYISMTDRQISVRPGQSFWSRGPSLAAKFTASDFPSLRPRPESEDDEDYASVLQATMELTQILHNAHAVLYSSKERTMAMVYEGHYSQYLDDFRTAATTWHSTWYKVAVSARIRSTLLMMYEYICLYTNAFSFQAVLTRTLGPRILSNREEQRKQLFAELSSTGIMSSPDGRYIFDAISAAINLLSLMNDRDPQQELCYLPYGIYAAVLLHKAECAGAFQTGPQREEMATLARQFISVLEKTPSPICHRYSRMLKQLWHHRRNPKPVPVHTEAPLPREEENDDQSCFPQFPGDLSIEWYLFGSFMPGVADSGFSTVELTG
ncbi:hypothetical protein BO94DRAFT_457543 [Aspergillus sclerotioniger CBS 115572]|uniref:Zn(2)-C6 fungal-type domain-containing protein n=1 Tax=Aspergillus sclerotioniger CBS 115572 TaxID=1450535 RepID=A0A317X873_9EURO|nr:hypothetical protein BO94DRAFT_457543 [Aspergillus sclerotioniger CBS 115572]PWY94411.1 hypothetical protein BO94DRAFT_457543 [Aspergillus sclerotioniger CBS 115572]